MKKIIYLLCQDKEVKFWTDSKNKADFWVNPVMSRRSVKTVPEYLVKDTENG